MLDKLKNLFNFQAWIDNFVTKMVLQKFVKHATTAVIGLLGSALFTGKIAPLLTQFGFQIDQAQLAVGLTALFTGLGGSLINYFQKVFYHGQPPPAIPQTTPDK